MTNKIIETDEKDEEVIPKKEIEIGTYKSHVDSIKRGIFEYKVWWNLTHALLNIAMPNSENRIDLRDKEMLKRIEQDMNMKIDYERLNSEILRKPYLIQPNGTKESVGDKTRDESGKKLTKKAIKLNEKKEKFQKKIEVLQAKYKKMKDKKCPRANKIKQTIEELEFKRDRT